jgi:hypothetical protein
MTSNESQGLLFRESKALATYVRFVEMQTKTTKRKD